MISSKERMKAFQSENHITTKGPLSLCGETGYLRNAG